MRLRIFGVAVIAAGALFVAPPVVHADMLADELSRLVKDHPQIRSRTKSVESAAYAIDKAMSDYLPEITASADSGVEEIDSPAERAKNRKDGAHWRRGRTTSNITITQNVFQGYATDAAVQTASLNKNVAEATLEGTVQTTMLSGVQAYIDVLRQMRLIDLAFGNEENIQRQLNLEDERVQRGSGVTVDVLQAKSRLQLAKERRVTFEGALQDAISKYVQIYNHAPNTEAMTETIPPVKMLPETLEEALKVAMEESPAILNSVFTVDVAAARRQTIDSEFFPVVDIVGEFNYEKHKAATLGTRRDYSLLLQASWDLFTGFSTVAGAKQVTADYQAALANKEFITRQVLEQARVAWQALVTTRERVELLENAVNIAAEVYASRLKLREAGKETVINVLDAENEISNAQINYTAASYDLKVAVYRMLQVMGRLSARNLGLPDEAPEYVPPTEISVPEPARTLPTPLIPPLIPAPERRPMPAVKDAPQSEAVEPPTGFWDSTPSDSAPDLPGDGLPGDGLPGDTLPGDGLPGDGLPGDALPGDNALPGDGLPGDGLPGDEPALPGDAQPAPSATPAPPVEPEPVPELTPEPAPTKKPDAALKIPTEKKARIPFWEREDFGLTPYTR